MDKDIAIKIENLSKQYRLGLVGTGTVSHDLKRWYTMNILGKEDPYLKIGEVNDRSSKGKSDYVWALKNINLEIKQGEVLGIIGKNGAGKSTLLKILSQVTKPTKGNIHYRGRIASLLEVGTGFHPEMTGRENIYMNGAIMGMTRREIAVKFDEIVAFAGVERYIDTPVKRYSSGMTVRLGFAIAAHLEPDILVVDEVLAVGDAEFQKKAIGKMQDVSKGEGRTVLFVSHNMVSIQKLCSKAFIMSEGMNLYEGDVNSAIERYIRLKVDDIPLRARLDRKGSGLLKVKDIDFYGGVNENRINPTFQQDLNIEFTFDNHQTVLLNELRVDFRIENSLGAKVAWFSTELIENKSKSEINKIKFRIPECPIIPGEYNLTYYVAVRNDVVDWLSNAVSFSIYDNNVTQIGKTIPRNQSDIHIKFDLQWQ